MPNRPFRTGLLAIAVCAACAPLHRRTTAPPATRGRSWSLSTANEATLTRERIYLDADRVDVTNP